MGFVFLIKGKVSSGNKTIDEFRVIASLKGQDIYIYCTRVRERECVCTMCTLYREEANGRVVRVVPSGLRGKRFVTHIVEESPPVDTSGRNEY